MNTSTSAPAKIQYRGETISRLDHGDLPCTWRACGTQFSSVALAKAAIDSEIARDHYEAANGI